MSHDPKTKAPDFRDRHVGQRIRSRRVMLGMSQAKLAQALGVTFQQVQKYEKGTNRIGASRLQQIAGILSVPVEFFFEGAPQLEPVGPGGEPRGGFAEAPGSGYVSDFLSTSEGVHLMKAFIRVRDTKVRRRLLDLVEALGQDEKPS